MEPKSGRLLVGVPTDNGIYLISKEDGKGWSRPTSVPIHVDYRPHLLIEPNKDGSFVIKLGFDDFMQWRLTTQ